MSSGRWVAMSDLTFKGKLITGCSSVVHSSKACGRSLTNGRNLKHISVVERYFTTSSQSAGGVDAYAAWKPLGL